MKASNAFLVLSAVASGARAAPAPAPQAGVQGSADASSINLPLKNGTMYNFTCPMLFEDVGFDFAGLLRSAEDKLEKACSKKDFSVTANCDKCLSTLIKEASNVVKPLVEDPEILQSLVPLIAEDVALVPLVDFSNGCPWQKACQNALGGLALDNGRLEELGEEMMTFMDECSGELPGVDYPDAFAQIAPILKQMGFDVDMGSTTANADAPAPSDGPSVDTPPGNGCESAFGVVQLGSVLAASYMFV
jgi:hypothetical protein